MFSKLLFALSIWKVNTQSINEQSIVLSTTLEHIDNNLCTIDKQWQLIYPMQLHLRCVETEFASV